MNYASVACLANGVEFRGLAVRGDVYSEDSRAWMDSSCIRKHLNVTIVYFLNNSVQVLKRAAEWKRTSATRF